MGIRESENYEIFGFYLTIKESHNNYKDVLKDLYRRELRESLLFIANGITDLDEEVMKIYPGSDFQLCTINYTRGLKSKVKEKDLKISKWEGKNVNEQDLYQVFAYSWLYNADMIFVLPLYESGSC